MKLSLKNSAHLGASDFLDHPVWAQYYSPDDIDRLVACGFERETVVEALKAVDWSDDYWFPVPSGGHDQPFEFVRYAATLVARSGREARGSLLRVCGEVQALGVFSGHEVLGLNLSRPEVTEEDEMALAKLLDVNPLYPIRVEVHAGPAIRPIIDPYDGNPSLEAGRGFVGVDGA